MSTHELNRLLRDVLTTLIAHGVEVSNEGNMLIMSIPIVEQLKNIMSTAVMNAIRQVQNVPISINLEDVREENMKVRVTISMDIEPLIKYLKSMVPAEVEYMDGKVILKMRIM